MEATTLSYTIHHSYKPSVIAITIILFTKALCSGSLDPCTYTIPMFIKGLINVNDLDSLLSIVHTFYWKEFIVLIQGKSQRVTEIQNKYRDIIQWMNNPKNNNPY